MQKKPTKLRIFFTPAEIEAVKPSARDIYIVVDVIRATTSITVITEQGARRVLVSSSIRRAQEEAQRGRFLLCGERNALPLPDFDYGNSPVQFSQLDLTGRELILTTTNGTNAFFACPRESTRLAGCFYNARAVTAYALARALKEKSNISIICAAERGYFALDDAVCAGYLAFELQNQHPTIESHESALAAIALYHAYPPPRLIDYCNSARQVIDAGLRPDLDFCMRTSVSNCVPVVTGRDEDTGLLVIERAA